LLPFLYLTGMRKTAFEPCIPTPGKQVPVGPDWIHEIKHDGYRMIVVSMPSTFWRLGATICAACPFIFARRIWRACWQGDRKASSFLTSNRARSALIYSCKPASSA
jgi:hypothetical protein